MKRVRIRCKDSKLRAAIRSTVRRLGLDRRKVYVAGFDDVLATDARVTLACSGCSCDLQPGCGCHECGYTGKRVQWFPEPVIIDGRMVPLAAPKEG